MAHEDVVALPPQQLDLVSRDGDYLGWTTKDGVQMLTGRKQIQVPGLASMTLLLSQDRSADQRLVAAFSSSVWILEFLHRRHPSSSRQFIIART